MRDKRLRRSSLSFFPLTSFVSLDGPYPPPFLPIHFQVIHEALSIAARGWRDKDGVEVGVGPQVSGPKGETPFWKEVGVLVKDPKGAIRPLVVAVRHAFFTQDAAYGGDEWYDTASPSS